MPHRHPGRPRSSASRRTTCMPGSSDTHTADEDQRLLAAGGHHVARVLDRFPFADFAGDDRVDAPAASSSDAWIGVDPGSRPIRRTLRLRIADDAEAAGGAERSCRARATSASTVIAGRRSAAGRAPTCCFVQPIARAGARRQRIGLAQPPVVAQPDDDQLVLIDEGVLGGEHRDRRRPRAGGGGVPARSDRQARAAPAASARRPWRRTPAGWRSRRWRRPSTACSSTASVAIAVVTTPVTTVDGSPALKPSTVSVFHATPICALMRSRSSFAVSAAARPAGLARTRTVRPRRHAARVANSRRESCVIELGLISRDTRGAGVPLRGRAARAPAAIVSSPAARAPPA